MIKEHKNAIKSPIVLIIFIISIALLITFALSKPQERAEFFQLPIKYLANFIKKQKEQTQEESNEEPIDPIIHWQQQLRKSIERNKHYPKNAIKERLEGVVTIKFKVNTDGIISNIEILQSSGYASLDEAAKNAVEQVVRTEPHPSGENINISIPIRFAIRFEKQNSINTL